MPRDVQAALKAKGVTVTTGLVGVIKNEMKTKRKGGTMKAAKKAVGRPTAGGVNKSDAVRQYLAANPAASPVTVQQALKARGIIISVSLASAIKYSKGGKKSAKAAGRPVGRPRAAATSNGQLRAEDLLAAKAFVDRVGGADAARKALDLLAQLS
ncbi:MAG: hypothetical protein HY292_01200 [Planctomycetes bacterium]|nr:hypothetical protein [Planctomycetota bacterium]